MRQLIPALALAAVCGGPFGALLHAQDLAAISFEQLTVGTSAVSLAGATTNPTSPRPRAAQYCRGIVETGDIRVRADGTAPTATTGSLAEAGSTVVLTGANSIRLFQAIRDADTSATLPMVCYDLAPELAVGLVVHPPKPGESTTGTGSEVHAAAPTLTGTVTLSGEIAGDPVVESMFYVRESFNRGFFVHQDDMTAESVTDAEVNIVHGSVIGVISYREEQAKTTSSWTLSDSTDGDGHALNIMGDNTTDDEGVEIFLGGSPVQADQGWISAQAQGACFTVNLDLPDISGTDLLMIGWRQTEDWDDLAADGYQTYSDWTTLGVNNVDGSIFSEHEVAGGGTLTDDSGVNWADGETRTLKSCIGTDGIPTAGYTDAGGTSFTQITMTNTGTAHTSGVQMSPFIVFLTSGTDGPGPVLINYMQIEGL